MSESNTLHVDDFIDSYDADESERYAQWFFFLHRLPAIDKSRWEEWISQFMLFCTYKGKRWRVTGASRLGDVWLTSNFNQDTGYEKRVNLADCSKWSPTKKAKK